jgi:DNA modification methylase
MFWNDTGWRHPRSIIRFPSPRGFERNGHPTQKPIELLKWLVRTYTRPGDLVCDPFLGSGTTAEACLLEGRRFIGFEKLAKFYRVAQRRIRSAA